MRSDEDKKRFSVVMFWLGKRMLAPGGLPKTIDADLQRDYFEALADIRIERIEWGAKHLFKSEKWFPMPAEIRAAAMLAPSGVIPIGRNIPAIEYTPHELAEGKLGDILKQMEEWGQL